MGKIIKRRPPPKSANPINDVIICHLYSPLVNVKTDEKLPDSIIRQPRLVEHDAIFHAYHSLSRRWSYIKLVQVLLAVVWI